MRKLKIAVSACLLGDNVRYDGQSKQCEQVVNLCSLDDIEVLKICPEMSGGLPCPREPSEIEKKTFRIYSSSGKDVTNQFNTGAQRTLKYCLNNKVTLAVLKSNSPSCGKNHVYDGSFSGTLVEGSGVTAKLLQENGIQVFDETEVEELLKILSKE